MPDRPQGRQRNVTGSGSGAFKKGSGLGSGPVGSTGGHSGGPSYPSGPQHSSGGNRAVRRGGGGLGILLVIIVIYFLFFRGSDDESYDYDDYSSYDDSSTTSYSDDNGSLSSLMDSDSLTSNSDLISTLQTDTYGSSGIYTDNVYSVDPGSITSTSGSANMDVAGEARAKRTVIAGDGSDQVTIMVYLCGTDLESKSGMASNDLAEMARATLKDNVNLIVYTGGCKAWKTRGISSSANQIYRIKNGGIERLVEDDGNKPMIDPKTLSGFIKYCAANYPANRNELIFWDHGGGSISGFGYDEKVRGSDSMDLAEIDKALRDGGVAFDFIGFDACLMGTAEAALMLDDHADYMIASEEIEPGIGWYYSNWLTKLSQDPGMPTVEIGKNIIDDYTGACAGNCPGQKTTLSIVDLAEFSATVPSKLSAFATSVNSLIDKPDYQTVSDARFNTREFAEANRIDQVDLVNLCENIGTPEASSLADAVRSAVKYNKTSRNIDRSNGVAIYFPRRQKGMITQAIHTYEQIGMNEEYMDCITKAASIQTGGQMSSGSGYGLIDSLLDTGSSSYDSSGTSDIFSILGMLAGGRSIPGGEAYDGVDTSFIDLNLVNDNMSGYISEHSFDAANMFWTEDYDTGEFRMYIPDDQWKLIHDVDLNLFMDDGHGYIDMGLDDVFSIEGDDLIADGSRAWLTLNGQFMPYYHTDTTGNTRSGYAPALLNGERVKLIIVFDDEHPTGYVAGAEADYRGVNTQASAKSTIGLNVGDRIQFLCDYYTYDFEYDDSYMFGNEIVVSDDMIVSDGSFADETLVITYRLTDIYEREYWTPKIVSEQ